MVFAAIIGLWGLAFCVPPADAQGGNGEVKIWVETESDVVEIPSDFSVVELPLQIRATANNFTCLSETTYTVNLRVVTPPDVPTWAAYSYGPKYNVTFTLDGDYRYVNPNGELEVDGEYVFRIAWNPVTTPDNATWVYKISAGGPENLGGDEECYFDPTAKHQGPWRLRAYLEGGEAPPPVSSVSVPTETRDATSSGSPEGEDEGGDSPGPAASEFLAALALAGVVVAWRRR